MTPTDVTTEPCTHAENHARRAERARLERAA